ncbi:hypothetical protein [Burkholderia sp. MBR-1]|uniref:hypothetical protein n=1 Tax=Burkholderia sp. MBR-1 TaxID=2732364 RepID=UPI0015EF4550|nr:hypothetical protein [Burkholderia sp. MBR-1]QMI44683.1 hypothetical protein MBR110_04125 [Burkholderia sp. MBR-1]
MTAYKELFVGLQRDICIASTKRAEQQDGRRSLCSRSDHLHLPGVDGQRSGELQAEQHDVSCVRAAIRLYAVALSDFTDATPRVTLGSRSRGVEQSKTGVTLNQN